MHQRAPQLKEISMRSIVGWTLAGVIADALRRADGFTGPAIRDALESTDLDVKGAIAGSRWTYSSQSHVPTRQSVFYQVRSGKIEQISGPLDPPSN
jgi:hypothetical protein